MRFSLDWITNGTDRYALPRYSTYYYQRASLFDILPITSKDIVFLGNSITNGCEWHELLKNKNIKNRGISGDVINGINDRIDEILKGKPSKIFLMAGINDISKGHSIAEITGNIDKLVKKIKKVSPKTKLYLQSLLPVNDYFGKFEEHTSRWQIVVPINEELKKIAKENKLTYVDVYSLFANSSGKMNIQYTNDGLHLLGTAYVMWRDLIKPYVEE
ncbi:GDSL-type esterase/lipase family protein [Coprobacter fastidiosus]|uniref:GDSL-type esterase/lipase family protein n=1 Tax=Coprobacter fastidiosus TaxID=1099853 RepID=UPI00349ECD04